MKRAFSLSAALAIAVSALALLAGPAAAAPELPSGFQDSIVLSETPEPTTMRFAPGGEVFVATKSGQIFVYEDIEDKTPAVFADLRTEVYDNGDRGLLGLALDPDFASNRYVYALYTYDHILGGQGEEGKVPRWGAPNTSGDPCPKPNDADVDACPVSGRLVRLTAEGDHAAPSAGAPAEKVLLEDWCQQFSSHSIGDLQFGPEGALYASGGDGASFNNADYGQFGWPQKNMCGDPPGGLGQALSPPGAEGGALRSQDLRTSADPTTLDGTVVRIDPGTGMAWPDNPMVGSGEPNRERIVAYGFRNPFRFTIDPATGETYVGNVGWDTYEEIDRVPAVGGVPLLNSGWPCYEGPGKNPIYAGIELDLCKSLYTEPDATTQPLFYYRHYENVVPEEDCASGTGSALAGLAFYPGGPFPDSYDGALFFADPVRGCIWVMPPGEDGRPDPLATTTFMANGGLYPGVDIEVGPEGDLYYVKLFGDTEEGTIHRISYDPDAPVARLAADSLWGPKPLKAHLDASDSSDPHGKELTFRWDLDGNGSFETEGGEEQVTDLNVSHNVDVAVEVSNGEKSSVAELTLYPDDTPPQPTIVAPAETLTWGVGQQLDFSGLASDIDEGGELSASDLYWKTRLYHCPSACHAHPLQVFPAVKEGSLLAPDHDYPSHIEISLTATDARGLTATKAISIYPRAVDLKIDSDPGGIGLTAGQLSGSVPIEFRAIEGAHIGLSAPLTADVGGREYRWQSWSDGGARAHTIVASASATYTAKYALPSGPPLPPPPPPRLPRPLPGIHAHLPRFTPRRGAVFSLTSSQPGVGFRCRLDAKPFSPCGATRAYRHLALGWHTFRAIAVGGEDWTDSPPAVFHWKVVCVAGERATRQRRACARRGESAGRRGR